MLIMHEVSLQKHALVCQMPAVQITMWELNINVHCMEVSWIWNGFAKAGCDCQGRAVQVEELELNRQVQRAAGKRLCQTQRRESDKASSVSSSCWPGCSRRQHPPPRCRSPPAPCPAPALTSPVRCRRSQVLGVKEGSDEASIAAGCSKQSSCSGLSCCSSQGAARTCRTGRWPRTWRKCCAGWGGVRGVVAVPWCACMPAAALPAWVCGPAGIRMSDRSCAVAQVPRNVLHDAACKAQPRCHHARVCLLQLCQPHDPAKHIL